MGAVERGFTRRSVVLVVAYSFGLAVAIAVGWQLLPQRTAPTVGGALLFGAGYFWGKTPTWAKLQRPKRGSTK